MPNKVLSSSKQWVMGLPYGLLFVMAGFMALAPFQPEPHLVQKFNWLISGVPFKAIDVFDVVWHLLPMILIGVKWLLMNKEAKKAD